MAQKLDKEILKKVKAYLHVLDQHRLYYKSAWLFGSFAQNRAVEDSDIDIAMVMPEVENKFFKELELTKYRRGIDTRIEPHIINAYDLDTPFYEEVTKGIKIGG